MSVIDITEILQDKLDIRVLGELRAQALKPFEKVAIFPGIEHPLISANKTVNGLEYTWSSLHGGSGTITNTRRIGYSLFNASDKAVKSLRDNYRYTPGGMVKRGVSHER